MKHYKIKQSITDRSSVSVDLYLKDISKFPLLTCEEEKTLASKAREGDEKSKQKLIESNLRFVVSIAKQYQGNGIDLPDLISVGNLGLIEAAKRFDPSFNCRFVSYAIWWIRDYILKELFVNGKTIKMPTGKVVAVNKFNKIISEYENAGDNPPSIEEMAAIMGVSEEEMKELIAYSQIRIFNEEKVNPNGDIESIYDTIPSNDFDPEQGFKETTVSVEVDDILKEVLNPIEYQTITKIFGLDGNPKPFEETALDLNLTKERVRQIKDKAIIKLRRSSKLNEMLKYF